MHAIERHVHSGRIDKERRFPSADGRQASLRLDTGYLNGTGHRDYARRRRVRPSAREIEIAVKVNGSTAVHGGLHVGDIVRGTARAINVGCQRGQGNEESRCEAGDQHPIQTATVDWPIVRMSFCKGNHGVVSVRRFAVSLSND